MIPKKYIISGFSEKSPLVKAFIESWQKIQPDFEIIEWTEDNFDVNQCEFSQKPTKIKNGLTFLILQELKSSSNMVVST